MPKEPITIAFHIEVDRFDGTAEDALVEVEKLAKKYGADRATVSTPAGTHNVLEAVGIPAETLDGKKVVIRNPAHYAAFPTTIERVADDPTPEAILASRGDKAGLRALAKRMGSSEHVTEMVKLAGTKAGPPSKTTAPEDDE